MYRLYRHSFFHLWKIWMIHSVTLSCLSWRCSFYLCCAMWNVHYASPIRILCKLDFFSLWHGFFPRRSGYHDLCNCSTIVRTLGNFETLTAKRSLCICQDKTPWVFHFSPFTRYPFTQLNSCVMLICILTKHFKFQDCLACNCPCNKQNSLEPHWQ